MMMIKGIRKILYYAKKSCSIGRENAGIEMTYFMFEK